MVALLGTEKTTQNANGAPRMSARKEGVLTERCEGVATEMAVMIEIVASPGIALQLKNQQNSTVPS